MGSVPDTPVAVETPRGIYPARVDEKGRLKLPVNFQEYLGGEKLFITSLDLTIARIYRISVWQNNERILSEETDSPDIAEDLAFNANDWGADAEIDAQGRVLIPTGLRRELNLEAQPVYLECYQDGINIYSKDVYEARQKRARQNLADKLAAFKKKGLK